METLARNGLKIYISLAWIPESMNPWIHKSLYKKDINQLHICKKFHRTWRISFVVIFFSAKVDWSTLVCSKLIFCRISDFFHFYRIKQLWNIMLLFQVVERLRAFNVESTFEFCSNNRPSFPLTFQTFKRNVIFEVFIFWYHTIELTCRSVETLLEH